MRLERAGFTPAEVEAFAQAMGLSLGSEAIRLLEERTEGWIAGIQLLKRTRWRRSNFTHQHSRQIVNHFGIICVEDLHVKRMLHNHCLAKSISDAAWSQFFAQLSSKAAEAGREFLKVNPAHTTQDCSRCRYRQPMPLSERTYQCPRCFLVLDRDLNASYNIVGLGLQSRIVPEAPALEPGE